MVPPIPTPRFTPPLPSNNSSISFPRLPFPSRPSSQPPSSRLASAVGVPCLIGKHTFVSSSVWTTPPLIYSGEEEKDSLLGKGKLPNTARREDDEGKKRNKRNQLTFPRNISLPPFCIDRSASLQATPAAYGRWDTHTQHTCWNRDPCCCCCPRGLDLLVALDLHQHVKLVNIVR